LKYDSKLNIKIKSPPIELKLRLFKLQSKTKKIMQTDVSISINIISLT